MYRWILGKLQGYAMIQSNLDFRIKNAQLFRAVGEADDVIEGINKRKL